MHKGSMNPLAQSRQAWKYEDWTGDPQILSAARPESIKSSVINRSSVTPDVVAGIYPSGQHFRTGWNDTDSQYNAGGDEAWLLQGYHNNAADYIMHQDASHAFINKLYGLARFAVQFKQISSSRIPDIRASIMTGAER